MDETFAENINRLFYTGVALIAAGVTMEFGIAYGAIAAGSLLFISCAAIAHRAMRGRVKPKSDGQ